MIIKKLIHHLPFIFFSVFTIVNARPELKKVMKLSNGSKKKAVFAKNLKIKKENELLQLPFLERYEKTKKILKIIDKFCCIELRNQCHIPIFNKNI